MMFAEVLRWVVEGAVTLIILHQGVLAARRRGWLRGRGRDEERTDASAERPGPTA